MVVCGLAVAAFGASPEETAVRDTYAKLNFAAQVRIIRDLVEQPGITVDQATNALSAERLSFEFSNFKLHNVADSGTYADLVSKPLGDALDIAIGAWQVDDQGKKAESITANPRWAKGNDIREDWNVPASKVFREMENAGWYTRYMSYTVTVGYEGRTRSYNAVYLFGPEHVLPIDTVVGNSALLFVATHSVYPATLTQTGLRTHPLVVNWLQQTQVDESSCQAGRVCCASGACGLSSKEVGQVVAATKKHAMLEPASLSTPFVAPYSVTTQYCTSANWTDYPYYDHAQATNLHVLGSHQFSANTNGYCKYYVDATAKACVTHAYAQNLPGMTDNGVVTTTCHVTGTNDSTSSVTGDDAVVTATAVSAGAVRTCFGCACGVSISIIPLSFPSDSIWNHSYNYSITCSAEPGTPIIIDTVGEGLKLTSVAGGVRFDFFGTNHPIQMAWTARGSQNAFLVLDRGHGITSGYELFGGLTHQPTSSAANGFAALAVYDKNQDGIIDAQDAIWPRLQLWIDANHNGVAEPNELHTLAEFGILGIRLDATRGNKRDLAGNVKYFRSNLITEAGSKVNAVVYDMVLMGEPNFERAAHYPARDRAWIGPE